MRFFFTTVLLILSLTANLPVQAQPTRLVSHGPAANVKAVIWTDSTTAELDTLQLPQVSLASTVVARRINRQIAIELFDDSSHLNPIWLLSHYAYGHDRSGYTSIDFGVVRNDANIVSLLMRVEGLGAHPSSSRVYLTFDLRTGRRITANLLFSQKGYKAITRDARHIWLTDVESNIQDIEQDEEADPFGVDSSSLIDCAQSNTLDFPLITASEVSFDPGACLPHAAQGLDIDWDVSWPIEKLRPWLSSYGKRVVGLR